MTSGISLTLLLTAAILCGCASRSDYKPVHCAERAPYAGPPVRSPLWVQPLSPVPEAPLEPSIVEALDSAFARARALTGAPAMSAAVARPGKGLWERTVAPVDSPALFWASVGKAFTAVVVLQLAAEGKISLDTPVSRWIDSVPNGDVATVRDLLAHTSGLFSANEDLQARKDPRFRDPFEALAISRKHGAMFCPGARWRYSNTGYDLLGEIVRQVDGRPIESAIHARLLVPLGLKSAQALKPGAGSPGVAPLISTKERPIDPSWGGAAAPIASAAADMIRFQAALLNGRLLPDSTVRSMTGTLYPMFDPGTFYGLGMMVLDVPNPQGQLLWIGHAGGTPGSSAILAYSPADTTFVAVALTGDAPAIPVAHLLLRTISRRR